MAVGAGLALAWRAGLALAWRWLRAGFALAFALASRSLGAGFAGGWRWLRIAQYATVQLFFALFSVLWEVFPIFRLTRFLFSVTV